MGSSAVYQFRTHLPLDPLSFLNCPKVLVPQLHEEPLAPSPIQQLHSTQEPLALMVDTDERSLAAVVSCHLRQPQQQAEGAG